MNKKHKFSFPDLKKYTLGFVFSEDLERVLLIEKLRPEILFRKLNGVGGKLEEGELPLEGMIREFKEETNIDFSDFKEAGTLNGNNSKIFLFTGKTNQIHEFENMTDEELYVVGADYLDKNRIASNVGWLVPMCRKVLNSETDILFNIFTND